jgi:hypothetical protein
MQVMDTGSRHILGYVRRAPGEGGLPARPVLVLANFSEEEQTLPADRLRLYGLSYTFRDLLHDSLLPFADLRMAPFDFFALQSE